MKIFAPILLLITWIAPVFAQELPVHDDKFKFIENKGQWPDFVFFRAESPRGKMYVEQGRIVYQFLDMSGLHHAHHHVVQHAPELKQELIAANFIGAKSVTRVERSKPSREYYNFFIGQDQTKWASKAHGYADVVLYELYEGIHLHLNNEGEHLKYEFIVKPNSNPDQIRIRYDNAKSVKVTKGGGLRIEGELGVIEEAKPYVYQVKNGRIVEVACSYKVEEKTVTYKLGAYDPALDLVIDPAMIFASYSGSISDNFGMTATYDNDGNLYSGGIVFGNSYPTTAGAYDENGTFTQVNMGANQGLVYGVTDIFISKYSSDGTTMVYSTYLGGGSDLGGVEVVHSIICNDQNELYLFGTTSSSDFPLVNAVQTTFNGGIYRQFTSNGTHFWGTDGTQAAGGTDLIVAKFSADGTDLLASTYMGGSANDGLNYNESGNINGNIYGGLMYNYGDPFRGEIMLDEAGNCYVVSCTYSSDFPLMNPVQATYGGELDGVLMKFTPDLATLLWSTYWGGSGRDACYAIKFDDAGDMYVVGGTRSPDFFTTAGAIQTTHNNTAEADGFVTRFSADGTAALRSTLLGTFQYDQAYFLQVDRFNKVYVLGQTRGNITPSPNTYNNPNSGQFIMRLNNDLTTIELQTVFGNGNGLVNISPTAFLVDVCGNIYVSGWGAGIAGSLHQTTALSGMPVTADAFQSSSGDGYNFYLIVLSRNMEDILYGSYLGGGQAQEHVDGGTSRFDEKGIVYHSACGGCGGFSDFPTMPSDVWSLTNQSANCNNLVFKFDLEIVPQANFTVDQIEGCAPFTVQFQNYSSDSTNYLWDFGNGDTTSLIFNPVYTFEQPGVYEVLLYVTDTICLLTDTARVEIIVHEGLYLSIPNDTIVCAVPNLELVANSFGSASTFLWSSTNTFADTLNSYPADSVLVISPQEGATYYVQITNPWCVLIDSVSVTFISESLVFNYPDTICAGDEVQISVTNTTPGVIFNYTWSPDSIFVAGVNASVALINPSSSQYVYLYAEANNGCIIYDSLFIQVNNLDLSLINAYASPDSIPVGGTTTLTGTAPPGTTTLWVPSDGVTNPNLLQTTATLDQTTTFIFGVTDGYCDYFVPVTVKTFEFICDEPFVFVPNAFTPDGSGFNDILFVRGPYVYEMIFRIYNRWGELVFESTEQNSGWDGTFKGRPCDPDVYDYYLDVYCVDGQKSIIKGNVTLIR
jgi:gliding motility-associated-like protein